MKEPIRGTDLVGRWGGEEFVILLPKTNAATAQIVAERIRATIHEPAPLSDPSKHIPFTASLGIAIGHPGDSVDDIFRRADDGLYHATSAGRNCIRSVPSKSHQPVGELL
jgi:two-component system cell cycle response regulator